RRFFLRRPDRKHRIRIASRAEVETLSMQLGSEPSDDSCWYAAVRQVEPGWRLRGFWLGLKGFDTDEPEDICRAAYENTVRPGTLAHEIGRAFEAKVAELRTGGAA
ncbi:hypothetical protein, partial [Methylobacterium sp. CCH5-D2]|uniref:hypothetical protein n=1 Tax=Methylobacterium sp. CCH5-D2 TaxID=1768765 RepID=UPI000B1C4EB3